MILKEREHFSKDPLTLAYLNSLLRIAASRNWVDIMRHIISLGATPESPADNRVETDQPLYHACTDGQEEAVKFLLDHQVHTSGAELEAAASHGHASIVKLLLEHGVDVKSTKAQNCLAAAAGKGYLGVVRMLLDAGMNPNEGLPVPMLQAVRAEHPGVCQLLSERGATMNVSQAIAEATIEIDTRVELREIGIMEYTRLIDGGKI